MSTAVHICRLCGGSNATCITNGTMRMCQHCSQCVEDYCLDAPRGQCAICLGQGVEIAWVGPFTHRRVCAPCLHAGNIQVIGVTPAELDMLFPLPPPPAAAAAAAAPTAAPAAAAAAQPAVRRSDRIQSKQH
jgi:hypothetical protein